MSIVVSGSLAYDQIMTYSGEFKEHILTQQSEDLNISFLVNGLTRQFGGTAGNIAYTLALLGEQPTIIASLGQDCEPYLEWLKKNGISTEGVTINQSTYTATAYISTDKKGNQIAFFYPGSMEHSSTPRILSHDSANTFSIVSPGNILDMSELTAHYKQSSIPYIFDPGQQIPAIPLATLLDCIAGAFLLICNAYEFEMIKTITGYSTEDLLRLTSQIIITQGASGSTLINHDGAHVIEANAVAYAADPTGAGDAYRAGLLKGLVSGHSIVSAAKMGATCASFCVEATGTQNHRFTLDEFTQRNQS